MKMRLEVVTLGALSVAPLVHAEPPAEPPVTSDSTVIWVPGDVAPRDIYGNRAVANAPRPGAATHGQSGGGSLRGMPNWAPIGPSGADAESVAASPTVPGLVLAGVSNAFGGGALYRSTNSGASWSTTNGTGNLGVVEVEFGSNGIAWAATGNGLFTSTDDGQNWTEVFLPITGQALVEDVTVDPNDPNVIWVGLGQFLHGTSNQLVFKSTDGGVTWSDVSPIVGAGMGVTVIAIDPANSQRVYAAFTGNFGFGNELWVSTDGGATWNERSFGLPDNMINDIAFSGSTVYVAGGQDFGNQFLGLFATTDDGVTWTELSAGWPSQSARAVAVNPTNPQHILVGTTRGGVVATTNGGDTWTFSAGGTGSYQVNDILFVPGSPDEILLGMGSVAVYRSTNGGASFSQSAAGMSNLEVTSFAVNPLNPNELAASYQGNNDGGIFISTDAGQSWSLSQAPLPRWQKVYFGPDGTLYASHDGPLGRGDDGVWRRNPDGTWSNLGPGSPTALDNIGWDIAVTPGPNPKILWGCNQWLGNWGARIWSYNRDGTGQWELEYDGMVASLQVNAVEWLNGGAGPEALAGIVKFGQDGAGGILRSTDFGDTWAPSENGFAFGWNAWDIGVGPDGAVYVSGSGNTGSFPAAVFKSTDGGQNWVQQGSNGTFRTFEVDPVLPGTIYGDDVWDFNGPVRSTNDGITFEPWDSGFMPGHVVRDFAYGYTVNGVRRLYAATSAGGFFTELAGGEPECAVDWNGDGSVNSADISAYLTSWLDSLNNGNLVADFDGSGSVNSADISAFLSAWLAGVQGNC